jgi:NADP-dependent 3-hydroxy acid dehydrogenase YdfG
MPAAPAGIEQHGDGVADRAQTGRRENPAGFAIAPEAVARTIAVAVEQPDDVGIGDIVIRPPRQG